MSAPQNALRLANRADVDVLRQQLNDALDAIVAGTVPDGTLDEAKLTRPLQTKLDAAYGMPVGGIPKTDLAPDVQDALNQVGVRSVDGETGILTGYVKTTDIASKYAKPIGGIPASDLSADVQAELSLVSTALEVGSDAWLIANLNALVFVSATRDTNEAVISASITWPDGTTGTFTTDTLSTTVPGAIDAYHVTYSTLTVWQDAVTRDAGGAVVAQPVPRII